eukprot:m.204818 g.204818  ORF g.204818 m.204818 type:complete len:152 (+) comp32902_c0_seq3:800-1255(+)
MHRVRSSTSSQQCACIVLIVRGSSSKAKDDCIALLTQLINIIKAKSPSKLIEYALIPKDIAKASALDTMCAGHPIVNNNESPLPITTTTTTTTPTTTTTTTTTATTATTPAPNPTTTTTSASPVPPVTVPIRGCEYSLESLRNGAFVDVPI